MRVVIDIRRVLRSSELWLFCAIFLVLGVLVLPVPTVVIDALLAVSICSSLLLVVFAVRVQSPTELSTFPSILLFLTVFRLAVDVAVARAVLVTGDAGDLVVVFGKFVAGGNVGIGLMVFLIICVVQFIVIAKGSERVAEVAARFTLDGLPGRQMSIDADLRNGAITESKAAELRAELEKETQFHGAMDGAVRFVKGDVIAGLIIVLIILVGGIGVGVVSRGLDVSDAVQKYSILTIGGGLLSQIGSVLSALAAALLTTRSSKDGRTDLGTMLIRQFSNYPVVLVVVGVGAGVLASIPGLPVAPFLACGGALIGFGVYLQRKRNAAGLGAIQGGAESEEREARAFQLFSARNAPVTSGPVRLSVAANLGSAAILQGIGERYVALAQFIRADMGLEIPQLEIVVSAELAASTYAIYLHGTERAKGRFELLSNTAGSTGGLLRHDIKGQTWCWLAALGSTSKNGTTSVAESISTVQDAASAHLHTCITNNLQRIPTVGDIKKILCSGGKEYTNMLNDITRDVPLIRVCGLVRSLIQEGVPIHNVRALCAGLVVADPASNDDAAVMQSMRLSLRDGICARLMHGRDFLEVVEVGSHIELMLRDMESPGSSLGQEMLTADRIGGLREQLNILIGRSELPNAGRVGVVVNGELRIAAIGLLRQADSRAVVITWDEIGEDVAVRSLGTLE
jgi:type III secretion protein V